MMFRVALSGLSVAFLLSGMLFAQHGNGRSGGGGGVPTAGIQPGVYSSRPEHGVRPANPDAGGRPYSIRTDIPTPIGLNPPAASYTGILPGAYKPSGTGGGRYNRGGGALIGAPLFYPYLGYDPSFGSFPSYNETIDPNAQAFSAAQESLGEQIRQLSAELATMKQQQVYTPPAPLMPPPVPPAPSANAPAESRGENQPPIAVVLKNGQSLTVQSYAVMNGYFWDFTKQPVRKIPLSSIDIPASTKATEANGTEFPEIAPGSQVTVSH